jgi:hypothetical protein
MSRFYRVVSAFAIVAASATVATPVSAATAPDAPAAPTVGAVTAAQVVVRWAAPASNGGSAISRYEVFRDSVKIANTPALSYTFGGLAGGTTYSFSVKACNTTACSAESAAVTAKTAPAAVTAVRLAVQDGGLTVTWTASSNAADSTYSILYKPSSTSTWSEWTAGEADSSGTTLTGLTNGSTYNVKVRTTAEYGSADSAAAIGTPQAVPAAPVLALSSISATGLILGWTPVANTGATATSYDVFKDGAKIGSSTTKSYAVTGLTAGTTYAFTVKACNATGCSAASNMISSALPPPAPTRAAATASAMKVTLAWTNSTATVPHSVWYKLATASTWTEHTPGVDDTTPTEITSLTGGALYNFRVGATGPGGEVSFSSIVNSAPFGAPAALTLPRQTLAGDTTATISWTAPFNGGTAITGYKVFIGGVLATSPGAAATTAALTGLTKGESVSVTVSACNTIGCSASSPALLVFTTPAAATGLTTSQGPTSSTLTWTNSTSTAVTGYKVFYRKTGTTSWIEYTPTTNDVSGTTINGLLAATAYQTYVRAYNPGGFADTAVTTFTTGAVASPGAPTGLTATPGVGRVVLSWVAPVSNGGSAITDYAIQLSSDNGATWTSVVHAASTTTTYTVTALVAGTSYTFRVAAKNAAGQGAYSSLSDTVKPVGTPPAPTDLTATAGNASVALSWTAPVLTDGSSVSDYVISYSTNGSTWKVFSDGVSGATTTTVTGLTNGVAYTFKVAAVNAAGAGTYSTATANTTPITVPGTPTNVTGTPGNNQVTLSWTVPSSNGGSAITNYLVQYTVDGGATWVAFTRSASAQTSAVVAGLINGAPYVFRVAAVTAHGVGLWSLVTAAVVPSSVPEAPSNVAGVAGNARVTLSWNAPASDGGSPVTDYAVSYSSNNGVTWQVFADGVSTATTTTVTGLTNGTSYLFRVSAVGRAGFGPSSAVSASVVPFTIPGAPTALLGTIGNGRVTLSWTAPTSNGGSPITDYHVEYSVASPVFWEPAVDGISAGSSSTVTGLTNGASYIFRVRAVNAAGTGAFSATTSPIRLLGSPEAPTDVVAELTANSAEVSWAAPDFDGGSAITNYVVEYSTGAAWVTYVRDVSTATTVTIPGLVYGSAYTFRVTAVTAVGAGAKSLPSSSVIPRTLPGVPTGLAGVVGDGTVTVTWAAPAFTGGSPLTDYVFQMTTDDGVTWETLLRPEVPLPSFVVSGLTNGAEYRFRVAAVNAVGTGDFSAVTASFTPKAVPGAPTLVTATSNLGKIDLEWVAPESDGGSSITNYVIQRSSNAGNTWTAVTRPVSSTTSLTGISGLAVGASYVFRVAAVNSAGTSAYSATSTAVTLTNVPGAPTGLRTTSGDAQITATWTAPTVTGGAAIAGYTVQVSPDGGSTWFMPMSQAVGTSIVIGYLTNGTTYIVRVAAHNSVGVGAYSTPVTATAPRGAPIAPTQLQGTSGNGQVALSWTASVANGAPVTDYVIQRSADSGTTWTTISDGVSTSVSYTATGLTNGTVYQFRIAGKNAVGTGSYSAVLTADAPRTVPGSPSNVVGVSTGDSVALTWAAPTSTGGSEITEYIVRYSTNNGATWVTFARDASPALSATVTGLTLGTTYLFHVAAVNGAGQGPFSGPSSGVTPVVEQPLPTGLIGTTGNAQVALTWTAPEPTGGVTITDYTIQYRLASASAWTTVTRSESTEAAATVTGLTNGSSYVFRVRAVFSAGPGAYTAASTPVTPAVPTPAAPGAPVMSQMPMTSGGMVWLAWSEPTSGSTSITDYVIQSSTNSGTTWTTLIDPVTTMRGHTVSGLTGGTTYVFRVAAVNSVGRGAWSNTYTYTPPSTPTTPTLVSVTSGDGSVTATWNASTAAGVPVGSYTIAAYNVVTGNHVRQTIITGGGLSGTLDGLSNTSAYTIKVQANASGGVTSAFSNGIDVALGSAITTPVLAEPFDMGGIMLYWSESTGSWPVTDYVLQQSSDGGTMWSTIDDGVGNGRDHWLWNLTPGSYQFRVAAVNVTGTSLWSNVVSFSNENNNNN